MNKQERREIMSDVIDYGPHKLCTKHKHSIPVTAKCVYCELKETAALDREDVLKMAKLEAENAELKVKYEKLELMYAEALQAEINWSVQEALDYIREEMANE